MGTKRQELEDAIAGKGCLGKAENDEPVFILRGQDKLAPQLVRMWAMQAEAEGCDRGKVAEAHQLAAAMDNWPHRKMPD